MATLGEVNRFAFRSELRYNILLPLAIANDSLKYVKHNFCILSSSIVVFHNLDSTIIA